MKPREKLIENIVDLAHARRGDENYENLVKLLEETLKNHFAIGRWVSVKERLPGEQKVVITRWSNGFISYYTFWTGDNWVIVSTDSVITHWLELELPEPTNEKGNCKATGPAHDHNNRKWNTIPRRSEVKDLLRLVDDVHHNFIGPPDKWAEKRKQLMQCAEKMRKEWDL